MTKIKLPQFSSKWGKKVTQTLTYESDSAEQSFVNLQLLADNGHDDQQSQNIFDVEKQNQMRERGAIEPGKCFEHVNVTK